MQIDFEYKLDVLKPSTQPSNKAYTRWAAEMVHFNVSAGLYMLMAS